MGHAAVHARRHCEYDEAQREETPGPGSGFAPSPGKNSPSSRSRFGTPNEDAAGARDAPTEGSTPPPPVEDALQSADSNAASPSMGSRRGIACFLSRRHCHHTLTPTAYRLRRAGCRRLWRPALITINMALILLKLHRSTYDRNSESIMIWPVQDHKGGIP